MNLPKERNAIYTALDDYRARLDSIPDEQFTKTPTGGGWSYAEVYSHILQATLGSSIALERCINNTCHPTTQKLTFLGKMMLFTGRFPPVRVKVPQSVAAKMPVTKISKEEAKNLIIKSRKRMDDILPLLKEADLNARHKHPRLGMLNANQWLKFIRIHLLHHLKQLDRIRKKVLN
jgi:hypothetical protein